MPPPQVQWHMNPSPLTKIFYFPPLLNNVLKKSIIIKNLVYIQFHVFSLYAVSPNWNLSKIWFTLKFLTILKCDPIFFSQYIFICRMWWKHIQTTPIWSKQDKREIWNYLIESYPLRVKVFKLFYNKYFYFTYKINDINESKKLGKLIR